MTGIIKLTASLTIIAIASLAVLLVFDVIPSGVFSEGVQKTVLLAVIAGLATVAVGFIARIGK